MADEPAAAVTPAVAALDAGDADIAAQMLALWRLAHAQEAGLIGIAGADTSTLSMPEAPAADAMHFGVDQGGRLVGLLRLGPVTGVGNTALDIDTLVVDPSLQRRGIASALLTAVLQRWPLHDLTVTTATANAPALALYAGFGFRPLRLGRMGAAGLPVVQLLCKAAAAPIGGASDPA